MLRFCSVHRLVLGSASSRIRCTACAEPADWIWSARYVITDGRRSAA